MSIFKKDEGTNDMRKKIHIKRKCVLCELNDVREVSAILKKYIYYPHRLKNKLIFWNNAIRKIQYILKDEGSIR